MRIRFIELLKHLVVFHKQIKEEENFVLITLDKQVTNTTATLRDEIVEKVKFNSDTQVLVYVLIFKWVLNRYFLGKPFHP